MTDISNSYIHKLDSDDTYLRDGIVECITFNIFDEYCNWKHWVTMLLWAAFAEY